MGFPEELKAWRARRSLTQAEASELFQVTETSYANWETGRKAPRGLARTRVLEVIEEGSGEAYRELARFNFPLGNNLATLTLRGKQLVPEDFDRLKAVIGRLRELGSRGLGPENPVTARKRHAAPGRAGQGQGSGQKGRLATGDAVSKLNEAS
ncbi:MAG: helix-turn-helix domain-containing protein [Verrucomicrobia bacterium]|nr:helix-turn-helix domain-containing protein [Verrucomicrobiota bacterium]